MGYLLEPVIGRKTRRGTIFSPYIVKPTHSVYDFGTALLDSITHEGEYDYLDKDPIHTSYTPSPVSESSDSSPLTTPPASPTVESAALTISSDTTLPLLDPSPTKSKRKRHAKEASKKNRKKRRQQDAQNRKAEDITTHPSTLRKHVLPAQPIHGTYSLEHEGAVASTSYIGLRDLGGDRQYWFDELVGPDSELQYELIKWDPQHPIPLVDKETRAIVLFAGHPDDPDWPEVAKSAKETLEYYRTLCKFSSKQTSHRRGEFPALSTGISYGGGQTHPENLVHNKKNTKVLKSLVSHWAFQRLSGFATGVFRAWAPKLFDYYSEHLRKLLDSDTSLKRLFKNSVFAAATFNFGPQTVCYDHVDYANLPFGWCGIWSLGDYDYTKGGHIVLHDFRVVIEFPPGNLILIPSGVCRHSNTKIREHETRMSFIQFSAGGLFRWVDHGFQTEEDYIANRSFEEVQKEEERKRTRWQMGLGLFSTLSDLDIRIQF